IAGRACAGGPDPTARGPHMTGPTSTRGAARLWTAALAALLLAGHAYAPPDDFPAGPVKIRPTAAPPPVRLPAPLPPPSPPSPPAGSPPDLPVPTVAIRVRAPAAVEKVRDLTYRIVAENTSRAFAHHVTVKVNIPASAATFVR